MTDDFERPYSAVTSRPQRATEATALYAVGQLVEHELFEYRGVVVDVDPFFQGSENWYNKVARSRPPKDRPWYHVLVDGSDQRTYVAERNLKADLSGKPIKHPEVEDFFDVLSQDGYVGRKPLM
ncbi:MAG: heat shock protein HspQ [Magnetovibrionaceae bacterium]